jgi:5-methylcytosine-specific restriction protein A
MNLDFDPNLKPGDVLSNDGLVNIFKCSPQGGMRRSHRTNTLVIVSDHTRGIYEDRWVGNTLHYTGMGLEGDQEINSAQNKTLAESSRNNVSVYLFEVLEAGKYIFQGPVHSAGNPYQEVQPDKNGSPRKVWIFPLTLKEGTTPYPLPEPVVSKNRDHHEREAKKLSDAELEKRVSYSKKNPGTRQVSSTTYDRNSNVAELAKRRSKGLCQLCGLPAPFKDKKGDPFLESHHIVWLSGSGEDSIENTVALCPNCHRKMHVLNLDSDKAKLKQIARGESA